MSVVYKYRLDPAKRQITIPGLIRLLSIETQENHIVLYALVAAEPQYEKTVNYYIYGTGQKVTQDIEQYYFLGTTKFRDGKLMFHVFAQVSD